MTEAIDTRYMNTVNDFLRKVQGRRRKQFNDIFSVGTFSCTYYSIIDFVTEPNI